MELGIIISDPISIFVQHVTICQYFSDGLGSKAGQKYYRVDLTL